MNERTDFWTGENGLWLPPQSATTAHEIDALFYFILYTSAILTVIVAVGIVYLAWKYRRRSHADRPVPVKESKALELSWSVIPTLLVLVVFFWGFRAYVGTSIPPADAYEINVKGQKWFWTFEYPNGLNTDEIVVPEGQPVKLVMTSQDVLHSFFVPEFRIKSDVLPNRYTYVWFNAPERGVYQIVCTEYCGTGHSNMGAKIRVVGRDEFYEFLRTGGGDVGADLPPAEYGALLYESKRCNTCHSIDGSEATGPSWLGIWGEPRPGSEEGVVDDNYIRTSIINPNAYITPGYQPQMPSYEGQLDDRAIQAIAAFIRQINGAATPADLAPPTPDGAAAADSLGTADAPEEGEGDPSEPVGFDEDLIESED
ncbi:MAG: cytochrome c oxidase subunit II [Rubricoccaceae bacterium]|nr:cytochrome c oxidase subunit II [Rubricoccaceae bacterium]